MAVLFLAAAASSVEGAGPQTLTYQGHLVLSGQPVTGSLAMTFKLYAAPTGGSALWSETHASVAVSRATFTVTLGGVTPLALPFDQPYHLGITVGAGPEITPRQPLTSAPYAFRSAVTSAFRPGTVGTPAIQDGTIQLDRLAEMCATGSVLIRTAAGWGCAPAP